MENCINCILEADTKHVLRAILEQTEAWKLERIRKKLAPKWYDLVTRESLCTTEFFVRIGNKPVLVHPSNYDIEDDSFYQEQPHCKCKLCGLESTDCVFYAHIERCEGLQKLYSSCNSIAEFKDTLKAKYAINF